MTELPIESEIDDLLARVAAANELGDDENDFGSRETLAKLEADDARRLLYGLMAEARSIRAECDAQDRWITMIKAEEERRRAPKLRSLAWLETEIKRLAEPLIAGKTKHVDVPMLGRIAYRDMARRVRLTVEEDFIGALPVEEFSRLVEMQPRLKQRADAVEYAKRVLTDTGEVMPGTEVVEAHRTASISYEHPGMAFEGE